MTLLSFVLAVNPNPPFAKRIPSLEEYGISCCQDDPRDVEIPTIHDALLERNSSEPGASILN